MPKVSKIFPSLLYFLLTLISCLFIAIYLFVFRVSNLPVKTPLSLPSTTQISPSPTASIPTQINPTYLSQKIIYSGPTDRPKIALTLDADMTPGMLKRLNNKSVSSWYNSAVIKLLNDTQTPATLFLSGLWIEVYPGITLSLAQNPLFELGNHSYSHPSFAQPCFHLSPIDTAQKEVEISKTQALLKTYTQKDNLFFRFPGGCFTKADLDLARSLNVLPIQWNNDGSDAFSQNTQNIVNNLLKDTKNGAIIVLHLHGGRNAPKTVEALKIYLPLAQKKGFHFVKLSELLR